MKQKHIQTIYDIYENTSKTTECNATRMQSSELTGSVRMRSSRAALVCLVLLCCLLLIAVTVQSVLIYTNNTNYTQERKHLLNNIINLTEDRVELLIQNENLTSERKQLIFQKDNATKERDQLKSERNELQTDLDGGWFYYHSSVYIMSSEKKSWTESRNVCKQRGADLIIINSGQEEDFVMNITRSQPFWIGLTDSEEEGRWKWVDGTSGTSGFWGATEPNGQQVENCALIDSPGWADWPCNVLFKYICEKTIFK